MSSKLTVTIEWPAGSGKTTLMMLLGQLLMDQGLPVTCIDEGHEASQRDINYFDPPEGMGSRRIHITTKEGSQQ